MEALFINKCNHTKSNYIEMNKGYSRLSRLSASLTLFLLYMILAAVLYFWLYKVFAAIIVALMGVFFGFYPLLRLHIIASKTEKQYILLYNKIPESLTYFYDDRIKTINLTNNAELELEYNKIVKLKQTKNLYLLILNKKLVVMVDKNSFEKGTSDEFEKFIVSKAINAKNKL